MISKDRIVQSVLVGIGFFVYAEQYEIGISFLGFGSIIKVWGLVAVVIIAIELDNISNKLNCAEN